MPLDVLISPIEDMPDLDDYVTTKEAANELELHVETVRLFLRYEKLKGLKVGRTWLVLRDSIRQYQEQNSGKVKHDPTRISE